MGDISPCRREFLFNGYYDGVVAFLDRYHAMIHRAAGFDALRNFLLVRTSSLRRSSLPLSADVVQ